MIDLFDQLCIETQSDCNRTCKTCLRQTHPQRREGRQQMATETVRSVIDQAARLGGQTRLCLQHFNEPLLDDRIVELAHYAHGRFSEVMLNTNGDHLNAASARELDGAFDRLHVALYGPHKEERQARMVELLPKTPLTFTDGQHFITHYSPFANLQEAIEGCQPQPCRREVQMRMILSHSGEMLMCCEDIAGEWNLGNVADHSLEELWFGKKHMQMIEALGKPGGRTYSYCQSCPRPDRL